jgi:uncharacterized protein (DUF488 family)
VNLYTIGFTQRSAEEFFEALKSAGVDRVIDVRLNNVSQLAGYSKKDDLRYFLRNLGGIAYHHELSLAPTQEMLEAYRAKKVTWANYEPRFRALLAERAVEKTVDQKLFSGKPALLCSEFEAEHCHRRIVAEYLVEHWGARKIVHL